MTRGWGHPSGRGPGSTYQRDPSLLPIPKSSHRWGKGGVKAWGRGWLSLHLPHPRPLPEQAGQLLVPGRGRFCSGTVPSSAKVPAALRLPTQLTNEPTGPARLPQVHGLPPGSPQVPGRGAGKGSRGWAHRYSPGGPPGRSSSPSARHPVLGQLLGFEVFRPHL